MGSRPAALLELAPAATEAGIVAPDAQGLLLFAWWRRAGLARAPFGVSFPSLRFAGIGWIQLGEDSCVPDGFPQGELFRGEWLTIQLAPHRKVFGIKLGQLWPQERAVSLPVPVGFLLDSSALLALLVGELEPGPPSFHAMHSPFDAMMTLGTGDFGRDVHGLLLPQEISEIHHQGGFCPV